ncbi:hypothetical protein ALC60_07025 [Trachymyrmex zeteki]|uniref:CCHC-type domain-containing protein n=1 Tax=Mycetomoellerius zeteki TaxID=64791 RepID=A0A151X138_9HYME|nr:hypothetical protein ALC60_07025 [Trachymyrmex zeteki]
MRFANGKILEVKSSGRNKVAIHFNDLNAANSTLTHPSLKANGLSAFIPPFNVLRTGVIRNVPLDISEKDVVNHFSSQTIMIKFRSQNLPRAISFMHVNFPVFPYIPRVLMCFSCLRYGHVNADCKSKPRCSRCGNPRHSVPEECSRLRLPPICCNCGGNTSPRPRRVPPTCGTNKSIHSRLWKMYLMSRLATDLAPPRLLLILPTPFILLFSLHFLNTHSPSILPC